MLAPDGRVVMISGANRGIGLATAILLASRGYRLSLGARDPAALEAATAHLPADRTHRAPWDAKDPALSPAWVNSTIERFGRIDAVLANAGVSLGARLEDDDEAAYDEMWEVNFKGPLRLIRAALPRLRATATAGSSSSPRCRASACCRTASAMLRASSPQSR